MQLLAVVFVDFINNGLFPLATVVKLITGAVNVPSTFNDDMHVATLFNNVIPETFNVDKHVIELFNVVVLDTFKLFKLEFPLTFNDDTHVVGLLNNVKLGLFVMES